MFKSQEEELLRSSRLQLLNPLRQCASPPPCGQVRSRYAPMVDKLDSCASSDSGCFQEQRFGIPAPSPSRTKINHRSIRDENQYLSDLVKPFWKRGASSAAQKHWMQQRLIAKTPAEPDCTYFESQVARAKSVPAVKHHKHFEREVVLGNDGQVKERGDFSRGYLKDGRPPLTPPSLPHMHYGLGDSRRTPLSPKSSWRHSHTDWMQTNGEIDMHSSFQRRRIERGVKMSSSEKSYKSLQGNYPRQYPFLPEFSLQKAEGTDPYSSPPEVQREWKQCDPFSFSQRQGTVNRFCEDFFAPEAHVLGRSSQSTRTADESILPGSGRQEEASSRRRVAMRKPLGFNLEDHELEYNLGRHHFKVARGEEKHTEKHPHQSHYEQMEHPPSARYSRRHGVGDEWAEAYVQSERDRLRPKTPARRFDEEERSETYFQSERDRLRPKTPARRFDEEERPETYFQSERDRLRPKTPARRFDEEERAETYLQREGDRLRPKTPARRFDEEERAETYLQREGDRLRPKTPARRFDEEERSETYFQSERDRLRPKTPARRFDEEERAETYLQREGDRLRPKTPARRFDEEERAETYLQREGDRLRPKTPARRFDVEERAETYLQREGDRLRPKTPARRFDVEERAETYFQSERDRLRPKTPARRFVVNGEVERWAPFSRGRRNHTPEKSNGQEESTQKIDYKTPYGNFDKKCRGQWDTFSCLRHEDPGWMTLERDHMREPFNGGKSLWPQGETLVAPQLLSLYHSVVSGQRSMVLIAWGEEAEQRLARTVRSRVQKHNF